MKDIHSWQPRQPSGRIARQLFERDGRNTEASRRTERWGWLTPVAACGLTMLLAVGSMNRPAESLAGNNVNMDFAAEMRNPASSNTMQMVRLSEMDENVQWNVWPKLSPPLASSVLDAAATNLTR